MDPKIFWELNEAYQSGVYQQEETLTEEEILSIEEWVEDLIAEGYDLDEYTDEELYEAYLREGYKELPVDRMISRSKELSRRPKKPGEPRWGKNDERASHIKKTAGTHTAAKVKKIEKQNRKRGEDKAIQNEEYDLYDVISNYLVEQGFCDTYEDANVIMANMSEEWRDEILEAYVDPEHGESPSGRTPLENVLDHPKKSVRKKGVNALRKSMEREYGKKWKTSEKVH